MYIWKRFLIAFSAILFLNASAYAGKVVVTNPQTNKGEKYVVSELEEGGKFFHDRDYTITGIPKEFLGLPQILSSADSLGGVDYRWTFEIDRSAIVYLAFDTRFPRPEDRKQDPKGWFEKAYADTKKELFLDDPHPKTAYWIYQSKKAYPKGEVTILGIDGGRHPDPIVMWTIWVEEYKAVQSVGKLTTIWGIVKRQISIKEK